MEVIEGLESAHTSEICSFSRGAYAVRLTMLASTKKNARLHTHGRGLDDRAHAHHCQRSVRLLHVRQLLAYPHAFSQIPMSLQWHTTNIRYTPTENIKVCLFAQCLGGQSLLNGIRKWWAKHTGCQIWLINEIFFVFDTLLLCLSPSKVVTYSLMFLFVLV